MRQLIWLAVLMSAVSYNLRSQTPQLPKDSSRLHTLGIEFTGGLLTSTAVGADARDIRQDIRSLRDNPDFAGGLFPKLGAYLGVLVDYRFHEMVSIGTGLVYSSKGYWLFAKDKSSDFSNKRFYSVHYFDMPVFLQFYPHPKVWFRAGPVFSLAGITRLRKVSRGGGYGDNDWSQYRFGNGGDTEVAKSFVPGLEASLSYGNPSGWHGTLGVQYGGNMYYDEHNETRLVVFQAGLAYTLVK